MKRLLVVLALGWMQAGCLAWSLAVDAGNLVKLSAAKEPVGKAVFDRVFAARGRDLAGTIAFFKGLEEINGDPVEYLEQWLQGRKDS